MFLANYWHSLSWSGCWLYKCVQLSIWIKSILRIHVLFYILCHSRKSNRKFKWWIIFYSYEWVLNIRKIKCACWNIYHWKKGISKKICKPVVYHRGRQTSIDLHNPIRSGQAHFASGAISGLQNTLRAISLSMESNKNKISMTPYYKFLKILASGSTSTKNLTTTLCGWDSLTHSAGQ